MKPRRLQMLGFHTMTPREARRALWAGRGLRHKATLVLDRVVHPILMNLHLTLQPQNPKSWLWGSTAFSCFNVPAAGDVQHKTWTTPKRAKSALLLPCGGPSDRRTQVSFDGSGRRRIGGRGLVQRTRWNRHGKVQFAERKRPLDPGRSGSCTTTHKHRRKSA